ncbi:MAG: AAA-like domain-containing protein [Chloroflexi bacterium]|nr:AAA-like domain-containing protein [Chloroflexota bacterium]
MTKRNPFRYLQSVSPSDFVGRWPLVESIAQDLILENGDSHAIIAGQRYGKTSILSALSHQLYQPAVLEAADCLALPLYIDFKACAFNSAEAVFAFIFQRIHRQFNTVVRQHPLALWPTPLRLGARWFEKLLTASELSMHDFEDGLGYIMDQLDKPHAPARLVLMLDDIGKSFDQPWTDELYSQARALICSSELQTRIRLVLTGSQRFLEQQAAYSAPLCDVLKLNYMEAFDLDSIAQLVARADNFSPETSEAVLRQSGGHPFLAQYLLYNLWEQREVKGLYNPEAAMVDRLALGFLHQRVFELEGWANAVGTVGLSVYKVLSDTSDWVTEEQIIASVNEPAPEIKRSLLGLCGHGLAMHDEDWMRYRYVGELFRTWFNKCGYMKIIPAAPPELSPILTPPSININTGGGSYIAGYVTTQGGGFIGRDQVAAYP